MSDSLWPHGLYSPWNSPGRSTGVGSLSLLQGIFPAQGSNPGFSYCRKILHQLNHKGSSSSRLARAERNILREIWKAGNETNLNFSALTFVRQGNYREVEWEECLSSQTLGQGYGSPFSLNQDLPSYSQGPGCLWVSLGVFHKGLPLPTARANKGSFPDFHSENLVDFLWIKPVKVWVPLRPKPLLVSPSYTNPYSASSSLSQLQFEYL